MVKSEDLQVKGKIKKPRFLQTEYIPPFRILIFCLLLSFLFNLETILIYIMAESGE